MNLQKTIVNKTKDKKGFSMIEILVAVVIIGILAIPTSRWVMSTTNNTAQNETQMHELGEQMEMQSIMQNYWLKLIDSSYEDFQAEISARGREWVEDIGGKYTLRVSFSADSKYENALCNVAATPGTEDRHCRRATLTLVSNGTPSLSESFQATRVAPAANSKLLELIGKISAENDKFKEYYTKSESDDQFACPWDYHMNDEGTACVPCNAPTWKQIRSGNCKLSTCPTGQKANANYTACEPIICPANQTLVGDYCKVKYVATSCYCSNAPWRPGWGYTQFWTFTASDGSSFEITCVGASWPFIYKWESGEPPLCSSGTTCYNNYYLNRYCGGATRYK